MEESLLSSPFLEEKIVKRVEKVWNDMNLNYELRETETVVYIRPEPEIKPAQAVQIINQPVRQPEPVQIVQPPPVQVIQPAQEQQFQVPHISEYIPIRISEPAAPAPVTVEIQPVETTEIVKTVNPVRTIVIKPRRRRRKIKTRRKRRKIKYRIKIIRKAKKRKIAVRRKVKIKYIPRKVIVVRRKSGAKPRKPRKRRRKTRQLLSKKLLVMVKEHPPLENLIEVTNLDQMRKIARKKGFVNQYEDSYKIIIFAEGYYYRKEK